jgi:hypothetical protein
MERGNDTTLPAVVSALRARGVRNHQVTLGQLGFGSRKNVSIRLPRPSTVVVSHEVRTTLFSIDGSRVVGNWEVDFRLARYTCAEVSFGCRKRSIQYAQPSTIGKRMRSTVTRTWTLGGGAPLKLSNQSAVNTTMNVQSTG